MDLNTIHLFFLSSWPNTLILTSEKGLAQNTAGDWERTLLNFLINKAVFQHFNVSLFSAGFLKKNVSIHNHVRCQIAHVRNQMKAHIHQRTCPAGPDFNPSMSMLVARDMPQVPHRQSGQDYKGRNWEAYQQKHTWGGQVGNMAACPPLCITTIIPLTAKAQKGSEGQVAGRGQVGGRVVQLFILQPPALALYIGMLHCLEQHYRNRASIQFSVKVCFLSTIHYTVQWQSDNRLHLLGGQRLPYVGRQKQLPAQSFSG